MNRDELLVKVSEFATGCIQFGVAKLNAVEICGHESPKDRALIAFKEAYNVGLNSEAGKETVTKLINEYDAEVHVFQLEGLVIKALLRTFSLSLTDVIDIISSEEAWELLDENYALEVTEDWAIKSAEIKSKTLTGKVWGHVTGYGTTIAKGVRFTMDEIRSGSIKREIHSDDESIYTLTAIGVLNPSILGNVAKIVKL